MNQQLLYKKIPIINEILSLKLKSYGLVNYAIENIGAIKQSLSKNQDLTELQIELLKTLVKEHLSMKLMINIPYRNELQLLQKDLETDLDRLEANKSTKESLSRLKIFTDNFDIRKY